MNYIAKPIGTIHTPFKTTEGMPIQPTGANGIKGTIELNEEFLKGIKDLDGFSHIILLYYFHLHKEKKKNKESKNNKEYKLTVTPFMDNASHGIFATRAPNRPNRIGLSIVKLLEIKNNILLIEDVDIIDGTPLLDIKPYVPEFDHRENVKTGWLEKTKNLVKNKKSDKRFSG